MASYFCGLDRKDTAAYESLPSISPVESWEEESGSPQEDARLLEVHKLLSRLWSIVVYGSLLIVTSFFVLVFIIQPYIANALEPSSSRTAHAFDDDANATKSAIQWVEEISPLVAPVRCHSHNDYLRHRPLFSALSVGCISVEADVWRTSDDKDLMVGHHRIFLSRDKTLQSLYLNPLLQILDSMNSPSSEMASKSEDETFGVFATHPNTTLILFIDVKDDPVKTWPLVLQQLQPLRDRGYLSRHEKSTSDGSGQSFWSGPITVVGTGKIAGRRDVNMGPDPERWRQYHDTFLDAPLDELNGLEEEENEFYTASVSFWKAIGTVIAGFSQSQLKTLRNQIQAAKDRGLLSRYWETPGWPIHYREYVWSVLWTEDIGLLNADDVVSAATRRWSSNYIRESIWMCGTVSYLVAFSATVILIGRRVILQKYSAREI